MRRREVTKALELAPDFVVVAEADNQIVGVTLRTTDGLFGYPKRLIVRLTCRTGFDRRAWGRFVARGIHRLKAMIRRQAWHCPPRSATSTRTLSRYHRDGRGWRAVRGCGVDGARPGPGCPKTRAPAGTDRRGSARRS